MMVVHETASETLFKGKRRRNTSILNSFTSLSKSFTDRYDMVDIKKISMFLRHLVSTERILCLATKTSQVPS